MLRPPKAGTWADRGCACRRQDAGTGLELRADTMGAMSIVMDRLTAGAPAISR